MTENMIDLYREYPGELHLYLRRMPQADGGNPTSTRLVCAAILVPLLPFVILFWGAMLPPRSQVALTVTGILLSLYFLLLVILEFEKLVFDARGKTVWHSVFFLRRRLARFDEVGELRPWVQEQEGEVKGRYIAVWRRDPFRPPLILSPRCASTQLVQYRRTIIPRIRYDPYHEA